MLFQQLIQAVLGKPKSPAVATQVTVGTTTVNIVAGNTSRTGLIITNASTSGQIISLSMTGAPAVASNGLMLWPGDAWYMDGFSFTQGPVQAIASAASGIIAVQEFN